MQVCLLQGGFLVLQAPPTLYLIVCVWLFVCGCWVYMCLIVCVYLCLVVDVAVFTRTLFTYTPPPPYIHPPPPPQTPPVHQ